MERIIALEKTKEPRESLLLGAYYNGLRYENTCPNFKTIVSDGSVKDIIAQCKKYNIKEITISACYVGFLDCLKEFQNRGCVIKKIVSVYYDKLTSAPAILISLDGTSVEDEKLTNKIEASDTEDDDYKNTPDEIVTIFKDTLENEDATKESKRSKSKKSKKDVTADSNSPISSDSSILEDTTSDTNLTKEKRHRRTKAEIEEARRLETKAIEKKSSRSDKKNDFIKNEEALKLGTESEDKPKRHRRTKAEMEEAKKTEPVENNKNIANPTVLSDKPKRHRRTKAEMEEARKEEGTKKLSK